MIQIQNATFRYDTSTFGLSIPRLAIAAGSRVALAGPSGCGKSTLLNLLAGVVTPGDGLVEVGGVELSSLGDADRRAFRIERIGLVFQEFELIEYLNVEENILLPFSLHAGLRPTGDRRDVVRTLVDSLGIAALLQRRIDRLSQGERQRVAICRALVTEPGLILADEPTGNVDPSQSREILDLLLEHVAERGATLIMATHDHGLLDRFDRVIDFSKPADSGIEILAESVG